ncbi:MAG TPA: hypothetical protein PLT66_06430, partial [Bacillota bacterium]|nr:hypothetical protein [Bacillota bacterium]
MVKKLTSVLLALLLAASAFIYSAAETTDVSETVSSEQESGAETSSGDESQTSEAHTVTSFEELRDAILDSYENIVLNTDISFSSAITLPSGAKITLSGSGSIRDASFTGSGSISISAVTITSLTVGDSAAAALDGSTGALDASGDCTVKITGDVTGIKGTVGVTVSDTAVVTVEGSVTGGAGGFGDGIYAAGSGKIIISGSVTGGESGSSGRAGYGIRFSNSSKNSIEIGGSVTGGAGGSDIGGTGIAFADSKAGVTVKGTLSGGTGKSGGAGTEMK